MLYSLVVQGYHDLKSKKILVNPAIPQRISWKFVRIIPFLFSEFLPRIDKLSPTLSSWQSKNNSPKSHQYNIPHKKKYGKYFLVNSGPFFSRSSRIYNLFLTYFSLSGTPSWRRAVHYLASSPFYPALFALFDAVWDVVCQLLWISELAKIPGI